MLMFSVALPVQYYELIFCKMIRWYVPEFWDWAFFIPLSFLGIWEWHYPSRSHSTVIKVNPAHPWATVASFPRIRERKHTSGGRLPIWQWIAIYIRCKSVIGKWLLYEVIRDILTSDPNINSLCISRPLIDMVRWKFPISIPGDLKYLVDIPGAPIQESWAGTH